MPKLSDKQISKKLQEGRNYKLLYTELKVKYDALKDENKLLKQQIADQKAGFEAIIENQNARIAELEAMVFGRKPRDGKPVNSANVMQPKTKTVRKPSTYRRTIPPASAITEEVEHSISDCRHCGDQLTEVQDYIRYEEDIVLGALAPNISLKTVTKQTIQKGWCTSCGKYSSAKSLRGSDVQLGKQVRSLVTYLITVADNSYQQTIGLLNQLYSFKITDGEITNILDKQRLTWLPAYEELKDDIRAGPGIHVDESRYPIQSEQGSGYAWSMSSTVTSDVVFALAASRGKGHGQKLIGNHQGIGVTDRYSAYKHMFVDGHHQICWAHLQRNAKDLTYLEFLEDTKLQHVVKYYQELASIYKELRIIQDELFDKSKRQIQANELRAKAVSLCQPSHLDPKKLANLKRGILDYQDSLFLCLTVDGIPADNNRAERDIRKLVIKRKKSFGVKTPKGARTMEVLLSVCWSLYNRDKNNFLPALHALSYPN